MPPAINDDWSDSDDENSSEIETSVLLGVPDAPIELASDLSDAAVSRIGGHPAFLPSCEPPFSSSCCQSCSSPMELLVQLWCPFEDSPMDRALYVWGCSKSACQGNRGSVRAWRGLRFNQEYATKLEKKRSTKTKIEASSKINPFSGPANPSHGLGAHIFGVGPFLDAKQEEADASDSESDTSEGSLVTAMASTSLEDSAWKSAPRYPALYLSTVSEFLRPQPKLKIPAGVQVPDPYSDNPGKGDVSWASEPYENSLEVDKVFERFSKIVSSEGEQCIRYELGGVPLPFSSGSVFNELFPAPAATHNAQRSFKASSVPPCSICRSRRVYECQLMPNLINVCRTDGDKKKKVSDEQRRRVVEAVLRGKEAEGRHGMEWGTCMIFSCEKDCCVEAGLVDGKECWREEYVVVQREA
ncbi:hypothetical protein BDN72DRAFT_832610 [Pluteus cervinus]|uniref:Uncharacterized protein n=1 Tax=Pluteus cervinus TaxID=181527 RepID=A0ACD3BBE9_9AGAR|nr:hypothetical protein BDN72DRAFT_832610 [Pluteus cervinus]